MEQGKENFLPFQVDVTSELSYHDSRYLSVVRDRIEKKKQEPEAIFRRSDIWDLNTGLPVLWEDLLKQKSLKAQKLLPIFYKMAGQDACLGQGDEEIVQRNLRLHFDKEQYYLTPDGIVFYYQPGAIAPPEKGCLTFSIPFDTLGICLESQQGNVFPRLRSLRFLPE